MKIEAKLMEIQSKLNAPKNRKNNFGGYTYRSCEDILEAVKPLLKEQKCILTISDEVVQVGERYYIKSTATLKDCESDEYLTNVAYAREDEAPKGMQSAQNSGACSSYCRKYCLNGIFCIDDNKDPDTDEHTSEVRTAEIAEAKISATKVKVLENMCKADGIDTQWLAGVYKVASLAELNEKQFSNINNHWTKVVDRCRKETGV